MRNLIFVLLVGCGHAPTYRAPNAAANSCQNECVGIYRTCETKTDESVCRTDLEGCYGRCFEHHGGTFQKSTTFFFQTPEVAQR